MAQMSTLQTSMVTMMSTQIVALQTRLTAAEANNTALRATLSAMPAAAATCATLAAPQNGNVAMPVEFISGTVAVFACNPTFELVGAATVTCLLSGQLSAATPSCNPIPLAGSQTSPGSSCKAVYADYARHNRLGDLESGPQWLRLGGTTSQVYCDMDTSVSGGVGGWTLCGKYNRDGPGNRLLANGFGRSFTGGGDMASLGTFRTAGLKWASIDCRALFNADSSWMMHKGLGNPANASDGALVRFTNILADVKNDATNFFDYSRIEEGQCRPTRNAGGVTTFDADWTNLGGADGGNDLNGGSCVVGDGHHFCSQDRVGARFSNGGAVRNCASSFGDTVYWAWEMDDHGCADDTLIGTGCGGSGSANPRQPTKQYNFLFVY